MPFEVPIKEHPSWDDSLVIGVTVKAIVVSIELAELGLAKDWWKGEEGRDSDSWGERERNNESVHTH